LFNSKFLFKYLYFFHVKNNDHSNLDEARTGKTQDRLPLESRKEIFFSFRLQKSTLEQL
jgi:hypothetical protein